MGKRSNYQVEKIDFSWAQCFTNFNRKKRHTVNIKQGKIFPYKVANLVQNAWVLYL